MIEIIKCTDGNLNIKGGLIDKDYIIFEDSSAFFKSMMNK